ncbi:MAG: ribonuclease HII [Chitinophagales bacterium]
MASLFPQKSCSKILRAYLNKGRIEAGCDEAGRGCLAGPVFAAAVILREDFSDELLNDSKQMSLKNRLLLRKKIMEEALSYSIVAVDQKEIDAINILRASIMGMQRAVRQLSTRPDFLLIDGNRFYPFEDYKYECIIKGDGKFMSIAAASILAKTERDIYMEKIHEDFPHYDWKNNKGYPTKAHRAAILKHGSCEHHRQSFRLLPVKQGKLF